MGVISWLLPRIQAYINVQCTHYNKHNILAFECVAKSGLLSPV